MPRDNEVAFVKMDDPLAAEKPSALLRVSNCAAFVFVCATNGLAGGSVGKVSNNYANHIVPDGWAFSIWGIIYTFLFGFLVYQAKCVECPPPLSKGCF